MDDRTPDVPATGTARRMGLRDAFVADRTGSAVVWAARSSCRAVAWAALRYGLDITVTGRPVVGPAVIVSNHPNIADGIVILMADGRLRPIARWHRAVGLRTALWIGDSIITTTATGRRRRIGAYAPALEHLRDGGRVWIAPEGGCQPLPQLRRPRTGAVRLAHAAGVPLQILAIAHDPPTGPVLRRWRPRRRPRVRMHWGEVVALTGAVERDADRMMTALAAATGGVWNAPDAGPPIGADR